MRDREKTIQFEMQYCQHYTKGKGADMICKAGVNPLPKVAVGEKQIKWGPCIEGHLLENPHTHCPHWIRCTREMGEKRADAVEKTLMQMEMLAPVLDAWRKKPPIGKSEVIECPVCKGRLHLSQAAYNGHVNGKCETAGCLAWME